MRRADLHLNHKPGRIAPLLVTRGVLVKAVLGPYKPRPDISGFSMVNIDGNEPALMQHAQQTFGNHAL